ncbi:hypothetical protein [Methylomonas koyamae]|uniref:hypothetical protein n=1 Tax=Methylomonas koyamae TaxID=702114 RepID=UPI002873DE88|nr:hypothetical protein [Methylomonas koyamae]WNB74039.1 hypothetical protein RI210_12155 [Methylomonas koyamae]
MRKNYLLTFTLLAILFNIFSSITLAASAIAYNTESGEWKVYKNAPSIEEAEQKALLQLGGKGVVLFSSAENGWWSVSTISKNYLGKGNPLVIGYAYGQKSRLDSTAIAYNHCTQQASPWGAECGSDLSWEDNAKEKAISNISGKLGRWLLTLNNKKESILYFGNNFIEYQNKKGNTDQIIRDGQKSFGGKVTEYVQKSGNTIVYRRHNEDSWPDSCTFYEFNGSILTQYTYSGDCDTKRGGTKDINGTGVPLK